MSKTIHTISLIGAGNVAQHLGSSFRTQGIDILDVFSRKKKNATALAKDISAKAVTDFSKINKQADCYLIAVSDDAIEEVTTKLAKYLDTEKALVVHTSGATPSTVLKPHFKHYGVFYPLQSFSKTSKPDFRQIPLCIDGHYAADRKAMQKLAALLSPKVYLINDAARAKLHVAAVFVNNFSNYMYQAAAEILEGEQLPFDLLRPLLLETALKVQDQSPKDMQTGPAIRGDTHTIERHLS
ncbi:MAG TPA: DUF2520 domain-containing protein, partial [Phaeodactylibacter sp.]|nr:DUF2520 domain-containing protein [Phaeodactylibacter sp.]